MGKKSEDEALEDTAELMDWLEYIDAELMREVIVPNEMYSAMFRYFDSAPWKPLTPRELLQFWGLLSDEEKCMVLLVIE